MNLSPIYFSAADDQWCGHPPLSTSVFSLAMLQLSLSLSPTAPQQSDIWQLGGAGPLTLRLLPLLHLLHPLQWCHLFWTTSEHHHLRSQRESDLFGCSLVEILSLSLSLSLSRIHCPQYNCFLNCSDGFIETLLQKHHYLFVIVYWWWHISLMSSSVLSAAVAKSYVLGFVAKIFTSESTY